MTVESEAELRKMAHAHIDAIMDAWPVMQNLARTPDVPRGERNIGGASSPQNDHSDPTASQALALAGRGNAGHAWLKQVATALMALSKLSAQVDDMTGEPVAACHVCRHVIGAQRAVDGCHRFCYDQRRKQRVRKMMPTMFEQ